MNTPRHLPAPWTTEEGAESFVVKAANGQALAYIFFEDELIRRSLLGRLNRDEARRVAAAIARLPELIMREG
jgi:hypothetical protein